MDSPTRRAATPEPDVRRAILTALDRADAYTGADRSSSPASDFYGAPLAAVIRYLREELAVDPREDGTPRE